MFFSNRQSELRNFDLCIRGSAASISCNCVLFFITGPLIVIFAVELVLNRLDSKTVTKYCTRFEKSKAPKINIAGQMGQHFVTGTMAKWFIGTRVDP